MKSRKQVINDICQSCSEAFDTVNPTTLPETICFKEVKIKDVVKYVMELYEREIVDQKFTQLHSKFEDKFLA